VIAAASFRRFSKTVPDVDRRLRPFNIFSVRHLHGLPHQLLHEPISPKK
jgi:ribosomal protein L33